MEPTFSSDSESPKRIEIIIESSSPPTPQREEFVHAVSEVEQKEAEIRLVNPHHDQNQEDRRQQTSISNAMALMEEIQEKERKEVEANRELLLRKKEKEKERQAERLIRKEFESHPFLPISSLQNVKNNLAMFPSRCFMEVIPKEEAHLAAPRLQLRKLLTRVMLLAIEELRTKAIDNKSQLQISLLNGETDQLKFCYKLSSEIESTFFRVLKKRIQELYRKQIKLVVREFNDRNNLEFRRNVLNSRLNLTELAKTADEDLKCSKTKQEEKERMQQLIRESQKDPLQGQQQEKEDEPEVIYNIGSFQSVPSYSSRMDVEDDNREEMRNKEREQTAAMIRRVFNKAAQLTIERQERMAFFLGNHLRGELFKTMCDSYEL